MLELERLKEVNIVLEKNDVASVTEAIVEMGIMHLVRISDTEELALNTVTDFKTQAGKDTLREKLSLISSVAEKAQIALLSKNDTITPLAKKQLSDVECMEIVKKASVEIIRLIDDAKVINSEVKRLNDLKKQLGSFSLIGYRDVSQSQYSFMYTVFGSIKKEAYEALESKLADVLHVIVKASEIDDKISLLAVVLKKDKALLDKILKELGFEALVAPKGVGISEKALQEIDAAIAQRQKDLLQNQAKIDSFKDTYQEVIVSAYTKYHMEQLVLSAYDYYSCTGEAVIISGWVPLNKATILKEKVTSLTDGKCVFEENDANTVEKVISGETQVPVKIKEHQIVSSFIGMIENFGIPKYNTIDPTFFAALTFLFIFGFMFGDVGHGLLLVILGLFISKKFKDKKEIMRTGRVVSACGVSSAIFGLLYGSIFGVETLIPHLWVSPMHDTGKFFSGAIIVGVVIISLGVLINIVNKLRNKEYVEGFLGRLGVAGILFYWGLLALAVRFLLNVKAIPETFAYIVVIGCLLLLFGKNIILKLTGAHSDEPWIVVIFENFIEMMELLIGYLTGTISFIRIAAFALSHVGLFTAVFMLSDMASGFAGGEIFSWVILFIGNILIICFEGVIVAIQSLRLEYYEFFGKFFVDGGLKFNPIKIK